MFEYTSDVCKIFAKLQPTCPAKCGLLTNCTASLRVLGFNVHIYGP